MSSKTIYLVDFENVGNAGISGGDVKSNDCVHLFTAGKTNTAVDARTLCEFNSTNLKVHVTTSGDQGVDKVLLAFLGFLIASEDPSTKFVIISEDKGYDPAVRFLKRIKKSLDSTEVSIERRGALKVVSKKEETLSFLLPIAPQSSTNSIFSTPSHARTDPSSKTASVSASSIERATPLVSLPLIHSQTTTNTPQKNVASTTSSAQSAPKTQTNDSSVSELTLPINTRDEFHCAVQKALGKNKYSPNEAGPIASFLHKLYITSPFPSNVKDELKLRFPKKYDAIYQAISPVLARVTAKPIIAINNPVTQQLLRDPKEIVAIKNELNVNIFKKLGAAGYSGSRIGKIASLACANFSEKDYLSKIFYSAHNIDDPDAMTMYRLIKPTIQEARKKLHIRDVA